MDNHQPLVSIGMPVYNGENYIREAIESILNQSYSNFELIISDNASTDATEQICKNYLNKDDRIKYHRFAKNHGAAKNFNNTFHLSQGKYFKWAAHDDVLEKEYLERCVAFLEEHEEIGLCQTYSHLINQHGEKKGELKFDGFNIRKKDNFHQFIEFLKYFRYIQYDVVVVNGLFRSQVLATTSLIGSYHSSDFVLTAELIMNSRVHIIKEFLFNTRQHPNSSLAANPTNKDVAKWFGSTSKDKMIPTLKWYQEFHKIISKSNLKHYQKVICHVATFKWLMHRTHNGFRRRLNKRKHPVN